MPKRYHLSIVSIVLGSKESLHVTSNTAEVSSPRKLSHVTLDLLAAIAIRYAAQLTLLAIVTRSFGADRAGIFVLALAVAAPFFVVLSLGLRTIVMTFKEQVPFKTYLALYAASTSLALGLVAVTGLIIGGRVGHMLFLVGFMKSASSLSDLCAGILQLKGRTRSIPIFSFMSFAATVGSALVGITQSLDITGVVALAVAGECIVAFVFLLGWVHSLERRFHREVVTPTKQVIGRLTRSGLTVGLSFGSTTLVATFPQYALGWSSTTASVAIFAVFMYVLVAGDLLMNAIVQAWASIARTLNRDGLLTTGVVYKFSLKVTFLFLPLIAMLLASSRFLMPKVFGPHFHPSVAVILILGLSLITMPSVSVFSYALVARNQYGKSLTSSTLGLAICVVASLFFVPIAGVEGALFVNFLVLLVRAFAAWCFIISADSNSRKSTTSNPSKH